MANDAGRPGTNVNVSDSVHQLNPGHGKHLYPYTYLGIVKKVNDEDRMGRIWVYIREIDGLEDDPQHWHVMSYCSPFAGGTPTSELRESNEFGATQNSYGMWFPCADVGNEVVCSFINGDPNRGIWMGGLFKQKMNHMVPGIPATNTPEGNLPAGEYNKNKTITTNTAAPTRPVHKPMAQGLNFQGLEKDPVRGFTSSGGQRQPVSRTYGFLTPRGTQIVFDDGYKINSNPTKDETQRKYNPSAAQTGNNNASKEYSLDGAVDPESRRDECIRFRTRSGAQILISESEGLTYLINRDGTTWIEMTQSGKVDVYANDSVSVHSYGSINITAQEDVNIEAGRNINMKARGATTQDPNRGTGNIHIESAADTHVTTGADLRLLVGKNNEILVANDIKVRSDNWDQNVNVDFELCVCENQDISIGGERKDKVVGDVHSTFESNHYENITTNYELTVGAARCADIGANDELNVGAEYKALSNTDFSIASTTANVDIAAPGASIRNEANNSIELIAPAINIEGAVVMSGAGTAAQFEGDLIIEGTLSTKGDVNINGHLNANSSDGSWGGSVTPPSITPPSSADTADPSSCSLPTDPSLPVNPILAIQPYVNSLVINKDYTASISNRVPEHEPWEGHTVRKVASHATYDGPGADDGIESVQQMAALAPAGSTAYAGRASGGSIKGNTKPELATKDFNKVKETVDKAVNNPATIVSTAAAGADMTAQSAVEAASSSTSTIESVIDDIIHDVAMAATYISDGIDTVISEVEAAVTPVVNAVTEAAEDITGAAQEAMESISTDVVGAAQDAASEAITDLQAFADNVLANGPPSPSEEAAIKASTIALVSEKTTAKTRRIVGKVSKLGPSDNILLFIANNELYIPYPYPSGIRSDGNLLFAIGYGFQKVVVDNWKENAWANYELKGLTEEEAWAYLQLYLDDVADILNKKIKAPIAQNQFDAFLDLAYNRGVNSSVVNKSITAFNKGDTRTMAHIFTNNQATIFGDLLDRRTQNIKMFFEGDYSNLKDRSVLKKEGLTFLHISWIGEHLWKEFSGFKHKEFPAFKAKTVNDDSIAKRTALRSINSAWQAWERSTQKTELNLPLHLPDNKLVEKATKSELEKNYKKYGKEGYDISQNSSGLFSFLGF